MVATVAEKQLRQFSRIEFQALDVGGLHPGLFQLKAGASP